MTRARALRLAGWAFALALVAWLWRSVEPRPFLDTLARSNWRLWLVAAALALGPIAALRTLRFRELLTGLLDPSRPPPRARELLPAVLGARALNAVLPARFGEVFRLTHLRRFECPVRPVVAAIALETVLEAASFAAGAVIFIPRTRLLAAFVIPSVLACVFLFLRPRLARLGRPRASWARALAWTLVSDFVDACMIGLCLAAVGIPAAPATWCAILVSINMAILLPTPGNLGTLEAGAVLALGALGVSRPEALAFALLYHSAHIGAALAGGALVPLLAAKKWARADRASRDFRSSPRFAESRREIPLR